jgi:hypothetical protein
MTVFAAAAVAAVVIAAGVGLSLYSNATHDAPKSLAAPRPTTSAVVAAPRPSREAPRGVTRIEELPIAPPEVSTGAVTVGVDEVVRRGGSGRPRPRAQQGTERRGEQGRTGAVASTPGASAFAPVAAPPPKPLLHENLYGRD